MHFQRTDLCDAWLITAEPARDERGYFRRTFCTREFARHGLETQFVQHSVSNSKTRGTIRGMHFQYPPYMEVKLVTCLKGAIWDVIIDLRPQSPTYRKWQGFMLLADKPAHLYVPKGFAHGFQTLVDDTEVGYLISDFYSPTASACVRYDDPAFDIKWPLQVTAISDRDKNAPNFFD